MSKVIEKKTPRGRPNIYNWSEWFKRKKFVLRRGEDFQCQTLRMRQYLYDQAKRLRVKVSVKLDEDSQTLEVAVTPS